MICGRKKTIEKKNAIIQTANLSKKEESEFPIKLTIIKKTPMRSKKKNII